MTGTLPGTPAEPGMRLVSEDELRRLAEDAARYRWLRDKSDPPHKFYVSVPVEFHGERFTPSDVDAYIDAAMKGHP